MYDPSRIFLNLVRGPFVEGEEPTFLIPGAGRSGTSSLVHYLREHPQIYLTPVKEVQYFTTFYWKGHDWYRSQFQPPPEAEALGEASTNYLYETEAAERIWRFDPDIKLLFVLRDPTQRAYSQYKREIQTHGRTETFQDVIENDPRFKRRGLYYRHLQRFLEYFSPDQMAVFVADQFFGETSTVLEEICRFLGVDPTFNFERHRREMQNKSTLPKSRLAQKLIYRIFGQRDTETIPARYLRGGARYVLTRLNQSSEADFPTPNPATIESLRRFYDDDVAQLDEFLEFPLGDYWDYPSLK